MTPRRIHLWLAATPLVIMGAYLLGNHMDRKPTKGVEAALQVAESSADSTGSEQNGKPATNADVKLRRLEQQLLGVQRSLGDLQDQRDEEAQVARRAQEDVSPEALMKRQALQERGRAELIELRKVSEPRDAAWGNLIKNELDRQVVEHFPATRVGELACFSSICDLRLSHDDKTEQQKFRERFSLQFREFDSLFFQEEATDDGRRHTRIRLVRKGEGQAFEQELHAHLALHQE